MTRWCYAEVTDISEAAFAAAGCSARQSTPTGQCCREPGSMQLSKRGLLPPAAMHHNVDPTGR